MAKNISQSAPAIQLSGISKSFGPVQANKDIDLVPKKEVNLLVKGIVRCNKTLLTYLDPSRIAQLFKN